jgi:elongation factor G
MMAAVRKATIARKIVPVFCGSAFKNKGVQIILNAVVAYLPSPLDIPPVICAVEKEANSRMADDKAPFAGMAFKIMSDKHMGKLTYVRIYSGTLNQGEAVYNSTRDRTQRVGRLLRMHANKQEPLEEAYAGEIVAIVGLGDTKTGDTLCNEENPIHLMAIDFRPPWSPSRSSRTPRPTTRSCRRPCTAWPMKIRPSPSASTRRHPRPSSRAWANCTWKSSSTASSANSA